MSSNAFCVSPFAHYRNICNHFVPVPVVFSSLRAGSGVRCSAFLAFYKVKPYTALYTSVASRVAAIKPYGFIESIKA